MRGRWRYGGVQTDRKVKGLIARKHAEFGRIIVVDAHLVVRREVEMQEAEEAILPWLDGRLKLHSRESGPRGHIHGADEAVSARTANRAQYTLHAGYVRLIADPADL
jgi:hypothetical protein